MCATSSSWRRVDRPQSVPKVFTVKRRRHCVSYFTLSQKPFTEALARWNRRDVGSYSQFDAASGTCAVAPFEREHARGQVMRRTKSAEPTTVVADDPADRKGVLKAIGGSQSDNWNIFLRIRPSARSGSEMPTKKPPAQLSGGDPGRLLRDPVLPHPFRVSLEPWQKPISPGNPLEPCFRDNASFSVLPYAQASGAVAPSN